MTIQQKKSRKKFLTTELIFGFLGPYLCHIEVPRPGFELELHVLAYAIATRDLNHVCNLHHSSRQCQILNLLSEARDQTCNLMVHSQICFQCAMKETPIYTF